MKTFFSYLQKWKAIYRALMLLLEKEEIAHCTFPGCNKAYHTTPPTKMPAFCDDHKWPVLSKCFFCGDDLLHSGDADECSLCGMSIFNVKSDVALLFFTLEYFPDRLKSLESIGSIYYDFISERHKKKKEYFPLLRRERIGAGIKTFVDPVFFKRCDNECRDLGRWVEQHLNNEIKAYLIKIGKWSE